MKTIKICTPNPEKSTCFQSGAQGESLLRSALQAGVGFPYECHSGGCGSCRFELLSGEVQDLWPEAPGLSARDRSRQRYLACQCVALSDLEIRVSTADEYVPKVAPHRQTVRLIERLPLTHDLFELRFQADGTAEFLAGQYALLGLPAGLRAYSMSNTANAAGEWHF